ncbi:hypothetical protein [Haloferula sp.]|uniref:hypothetical protein n=1 Tax=Haloferula sp. TaxID=2497595 RepID=UPI003C75FBA4
MTTQEIQQHINAAVRSKFDESTSESLEMMTSEGGDGRFMGRVIATRYAGHPEVEGVFLAIGKTERGVQIVKFGMSESLNPEPSDLDFLLRKELGIEREQT